MCRQLQDATAVAFEDPDRLARIEPPAYVDFGDSPSAELDLMHLSVAELRTLIRDVAADDEPTTDLVVDLHVKLATPSPASSCPRSSYGSRRAVRPSPAPQ